MEKEVKQPMKILIDHREDGIVFDAFRRAAKNPELLKILGEERIIIEQKNNMESGDFVCGEYAIEHKSPVDYRMSTFNGHLDEQIVDMHKNFKDFAIAFSGETKDIFYDQIGTGSFASNMVKDAPVMICGDVDRMAEICIKTLHKWNDGKDRSVNISINQKKHVDEQLNIITGIQKIGEKDGLALLSKFRSIEKIVAASIKDLQEVEGIGEGKARIIYTALHATRW